MDIKQQRDAEIAEKTAAAIASEGPPSVNNNNKPPEQASSPSTYQQPPPPNSQPKRRQEDSRRMCRMFFPSSGHMGFDLIKDSDELPSIETLRDMIVYETRLRLSQPIQDLMDYYHADEDSVTYIHDLIQQHVVEYFGYRHVNALRTALHRFPDDPIVKAAFYVKHNKVTQGLVNCGQNVRDVDLFTIDGHPTTLFSQLSADQPSILLAGSTS